MQQPVRSVDDAATQVQLEFEEALKADKYAGAWVWGVLQAVMLPVAMLV